MVFGLDIVVVLVDLGVDLVHILVVVVDLEDNLVVGIQVLERQLELLVYNLVEEALKALEVL